MRGSEEIRSRRSTRRPRNVFVAGFLGSPKMNLLAGPVRRVENRRIAVEGGTVLDAAEPDHRRGIA